MMKRCKKNCGGWETWAKNFFGNNMFGIFALLNYGVLPKDVTGGLDGSNKYSNETITNCPWCGARLIEDKMDKPVEKESALIRFIKYYGSVTNPEHTTTGVNTHTLIELLEEIKERFEALEGK